jgi:hypothetical protein
VSFSKGGLDQQTPREQNSVNSIWECLKSIDTRRKRFLKAAIMSNTAGQRTAPQRDSTRDHLPRKQRVGCAQSSHFAGLPRVPGGDCSQNCSCSILAVQLGSTSCFCKLLKQKVKHHRVSTGGPMCPRRLKRSCKSSLFSITCELRTWRWPVEACGALLKRGLPTATKSSTIHPKLLGKPS